MRKKIRWWGKKKYGWLHLYLWALTLIPTNHTHNVNTKPKYTNKQTESKNMQWIHPVFGTYSAQAFSFWSDCTIATGIQWSGNGQEIHLTVVMGPYQVVPVLQGEETKINTSQKDSF